MQFGPQLMPKVLDGTKTQTRRKVRYGQTRCPYEPLRQYAVQPGRGMRAVGRILVLKVEEQELSELTEEAAVLEGFASTREFYDYWYKLYRGVGLHERVWVITFELVR